MIEATRLKLNMDLDYIISRLNTLKQLYGFNSAIEGDEVEFLRKQNAVLLDLVKFLLAHNGVIISTDSNDQTPTSNQVINLANIPSKTSSTLNTPQFNYERTPQHQLKKNKEFSTSPSIFAFQVINFSNDGPYNNSQDHKIAPSIRENNNDGLFNSCNPGITPLVQKNNSPKGENMNKQGGEMTSSTKQCRSVVNDDFNKNSKRKKPNSKDDTTTSKATIDDLDQTATNAIACDLCDKKFTHKYNLNRHRKNHFSPAFRCEKCSKGFTRKDKLTEHMKSCLKK